MSERTGLPARLAPIALIVVIAAAIVVDRDGDGIALPDSPAADRLATVLGGLSADGPVLVGFDPDVGTYAEIRPTVRAALDEIASAGTPLAFVSLTPEGRALGLAEMGRLAAADPATEIVDLGFVPGAEAGLVSLARGENASSSGLISDATTAIALDEVALAIVIGGNDLGPRAWVEQLTPRVDGLEVAAIAPSVLLPELQPYVESGQLVALVATPRDGASLRARLAGAEHSDDPGPTRLPLLIGLAIAIVVLGGSLIGRFGGAFRATRPGEPA